LLSAVTAALVEGNLPVGVALLALGEHHLKGLTRPEQVYQLVAPNLPDHFPALNSASNFIVNLPRPSTSFVGRGPEVRQIVNLLADANVHLLSLLGPGGTGKTRLAIQAAAEIAHSNTRYFGDGVFFVPLAPLSSADSMITAIAQSVGFCLCREEESPRQQLIDYLRRKQLLLVMDNMEHLVESGGAVLPAEIIQSSPGVRILATSRTRLNVQGEHLYFVAGMNTPEAGAVHAWHNIEKEAADYSAIQLFAQCATRIIPDFRLGADNIAAVAHICQQVQGLPLGIELAAAWLEVLSLPEIAAEIERNLDILNTELHGIPDRQRSIRAVFNTSWQLLSERERAILPTLSILRAGFSREAAEVITANVTIRDLLGLINKSWLQRVGDGRFQMHELLRQYAAEKLNQEPQLEQQVCERQALYFASFLQAQFAPLLGKEQIETCDAIAADFDNVRSAWNWLVAHDQFEPLVEQMLAPLFFYAHIRFLATEVAPLLEQAIARRQASPRETAAGVDVLLAKLLIARAAVYMNYFTGEFESGDVATPWQIANTLGEAAATQLEFWYPLLNRIYGWLTDRSAAIYNLRHLLQTIEASRPSAVRGQHSQTTHAITNIQSPVAHLLEAYTLHALGSLLHWEFASSDELAEAGALLEQTLVAYERMGNRFFCALAYLDLAELASLRKCYPEALDYLERAKPLAEGIGNWGAVWIILLLRREIYLRQGEPARMFPVLDDMLQMSRKVGNYRLETWSLSWYSIYAVRYEQLERARQWRQEALALAEEFNNVYDHAWSSWELGEIYRVGGDQTAARHWFEQSARLFEQYHLPLGTGFYHRGLGDLALALGNHVEARDHFQRYLTAAQEERFSWSEAYALAGLGRAVLGLGRHDEAFHYFRDALQLAEITGRNDISSLPLAGLAELALAAGQPELAVALAALVETSPFTWNETRAWMSQMAADAKSSLTAETIQTAETRGRQTSLDTFIPQLLTLSEPEQQNWLQQLRSFLSLHP
jgi:predicted ATPase